MPRENRHTRSAVLAGAHCLAVIWLAAAAEPEPAAEKPAAALPLEVTVQAGEKAREGFLVDAGIQAPVLDRASFEPPNEEHASDVRSVTVADFAPPGVASQTVRCAVLDLAPLSARWGISVSGLLPAHQPGYVAVLDFPGRKAAWIPLEKAPAAVQRGLRLTVGQHGAPLTGVVIGGEHRCRVLVDTLRPEVCALPGETLESWGLGPAAAPHMVTEFVHHAPRTETRLPRLTCGPLRVRQPVCTVTDSEPGWIGLGLLAHAKVRLSFELGRISIEPAPGKSVFVDPPLHGYGLSLAARTESGWQVGVVRGGPAWRAGIRPGDELLAVDNQAIPEHANAAAALLYAEPGASATVHMRRGGETAPFLLQAERLL